MQGELSLYTGIDGLDREWLEKESAVDDYIERGEFEEFDSMEEFIASLELDEK